MSREYRKNVSEGLYINEISRRLLAYIKERRKANIFPLKTRQLAERMGIPYETTVNWISRGNTSLSTDMMDKLFLALEISVLDLLTPTTRAGVPIIQFVRPLSHPQDFQPAAIH